MGEYGDKSTNKKHEAWQQNKIDRAGVRNVRMRASFDLHALIFHSGFLRSLRVT
jgi:hypothetical protein